MSERTGITVLMPAFNEADKIGATVNATLKIEGVDRVIVIDDGSKDSTSEYAEKAGAEVIRQERNSGKGAALQAGADKLLAEVLAGAKAPDIVLLLDSDLEASAAEAESLVFPIVSDCADMTIGVLPAPVGSGGFGVVKDLARREIRELGGGYNAQAPLSGQRALSWECFRAVLPFAQGYGVEVALTIRALKQDFRIYETRVEMQHRATGKTVSGFIHRGKQYLDVYRTIQQLSKE